MNNKLSDEIKEAIDDNICYFATASKEGKPNVVPVGMAKAINDSKIVILDIYFNKTAKNLIENKEVALAFTDTKRHLGYQFKGTAEVLKDKKWLDMGLELLQERCKRHEEKLDEIKDVKEKERAQKWLKILRSLKPKSVVLIHVKEIYSTMGTKK